MKVCLPVNAAFTVPDFITVSLLSQYPNGSSLMQLCSTLSYRCEKDVQFKQMSHAEIARHEKESRGSICIIFGLSLKTALVREEIVRYEVICTVCNAKFSFYHYNPWQGISFYLWTDYRGLTILLLM